MQDGTAVLQTDLPTLSRRSRRSQRIAHDYTQTQLIRISWMCFVQLSWILLYTQLP